MRLRTNRRHPSRPRSLLLVYMKVCAVLLLLMLVVALAVSNTQQERIQVLEFAFCFATYMVALLTVPVIAHELGHIFAGWLAGMRLAQMQICALLLRRSAGRIVISWNWTARPFSGGVLMYPRSEGGFARRF